MAMRSNPVTGRAHAGRHSFNNGVAIGIGHWAYHDDGRRPPAETPAITPPARAAALSSVSRYRHQKTHCHGGSLGCKT